MPRYAYILSLCVITLLSCSLSTQAQQKTVDTVSMKTDSSHVNPVMRQPNKEKAPSAAPNVGLSFTNIFMYDFFLTVNAIAFENQRTSEEHDEVNLYYNTTINEIFKTKYFTYRAYMFNEYGLKYYIDSVATKGQDRHEVRNTIQVPVKKFLRLSAGLTVKSQLWKLYTYRKDTLTNGYTRTLYSDYFSPGYLVYTGGVSFNFLKNATLDIGLVGGKTTKMKNQRVFEEREVKKLYGLEKGEKRKFTYAVNVALYVPPQMLTKKIGWECNALLIADKEQLGRVKGYMLDATNVFHYLFLKNLRLSLRTAVKYDESISKKVFMMNMLSLGFYLFNKL